MKFYLDTEFWERPGSIDLISIGIEAETGETLYLENSSMPYTKIRKEMWLRRNVLPHLEFNITYPKDFEQVEVGGNVHGIAPHDRIGELVKSFIYQTVEDRYPGSVVWEEGDSLAPFAPGEIPSKVIQVTEPIEFRTWYGDYDWVVFCWTFGKMLDLPEGFPMYSYDLKQKFDENLFTKEWKDKIVPESDKEHNALADAQWNKELDLEMDNYISGRKDWEGSIFN